MPRALQSPAEDKDSSTPWHLEGLDYTHWKTVTRRKRRWISDMSFSHISQCRQARGMGDERNHSTRWPDNRHATRPLGCWKKDNEIPLRDEVLGHTRLQRHKNQRHFSRFDRIQLPSTRRPRYVPFANSRDQWTREIVPRSNLTGILGLSGP